MAVFVREMQRFADERTFALLVRGEMVGAMFDAAAAILEPAISAVPGEPGLGGARVSAAKPTSTPDLGPTPSDHPSH